MITRARLRLVQRVLGTIGILIALSAFATMFVPFRILDIQCGSAITGAKVEIGAPRGSLVQDHEGPICHKKGSSRLITAGVVLLLGGALGYGGWLLPLEPPWYQAEDDDDDDSRADRTAPPRSARTRTSPARTTAVLPEPTPSGPVQTKPRVVVGDHVRGRPAAGEELADEEPELPSAAPPLRRPSRSPAPRARPPVAAPAGSSGSARPPARPPSHGRSGTGPVSVPRPGQPPVK